MPMLGSLLGLVPVMVLVLVLGSAQTLAASSVLDIPTYDVAEGEEIDKLDVLMWRDSSSSVAYQDLPQDPAVWLRRFVKHSALNSGRTWMRFRLHNSASESRRVVVSFDEVFPEEADLYLPKPSGAVEHRINGLQIPIPERRIKTRMAAFDIALPPGATQDVVLSYRSRYEAMLGVNVQQPAIFAAWVEWQTAGYMFFMGGGLAIVLFNLFLYASLRESLYLIYSLHAISVIVFVAMFSGFSFYVISSPEGHYRVAIVSWVQALALVEFTRRLLQTRKMSVTLDRMLRVASITMVVTAVMTLFGIEYYAIGVRLALPMLILLLVVGVISARRGDPMGRFFLIAETPYIVGTMLLISLSLGLLEYSPIYRYGFIVGSLIELVTFSLALGYRFRILEKDKFAVQEEVLSLQASLNEQLQQQVEERTAELEYASGQLQAINQDYESLLQNIGIGVARFDADHKVSFANRMYLQLTEALPNLQTSITMRLQKGLVVDTTELAVTDTRRTEHHFLMNTSERRDESGAFAGVWLVITDVTEIRLQESRLNHTSKMATLGEMSTGMAHELNQPLNAIRLSAGTLSRSLARGNIDVDKMQGKLTRINDQIERASKLISHMRTFGRVAEDAFERFDIKTAIERAVDLIHEQLRLDQVELVFNVADGASHYAMGSGSQFEQVILNMISNARDAIKQNRLDRAITITLSRVDDLHEICVEDTGGGIPPNIIDRIFEPFFTTKVVGEGTGLGGAISYGIVKDMHGDIQVSNTDAGARFVITLPAVE